MEGSNSSGIKGLGCMIGIRGRGLNRGEFGIE